MLTLDSRRLTSRVEAARERMARGLADAAREGASRVAASARRGCPASSGALRASIRAVGDGVVASVPYAARVELGTYFAPPKPFLRPALSAHAGDIREAAKSAVEQAFS